MAEVGRAHAVGAPAVTFRIIYYVADPFLADRIPLGALVHVDGGTTVVRAPRLPGVDYLGAQGLANARRLRDRLGVAESPQLVAGEVRAVPDGVDAVAWVEALFAAR